MIPPDLQSGMNLTLQVVVVARQAGESCCCGHNRYLSFATDPEEVTKLQKTYRELQIALRRQGF
jgi:hypothetical protein